MTYYHYASQSSGEFSIGGGIEYRLTPKVNLRGDFELQQWTNFEPHNLSPVIVSVGASYIIR